MIHIRLPSLAACCIAMALAACTGPAPAPPQVSRAALVKPPPDWYHRQLALARNARAEHRPKQDTAGAQYAYYAIMLPACEHIEKSGPNKYRPRCKILIAKATAHRSAPVTSIGPPCDDRDDSAQVGCDALRIAPSLVPFAMVHVGQSDGMPSASHPTFCNPGYYATSPGASTATPSA